MDNFTPLRISKARKALKFLGKMLGNERGEVVIPFIDSVPQESHPAVTTFVTNSGATSEELANYKTFDEFLSGYKPKGTATAPINTWKSHLGPDLSNSPTLQKFEDTPEGLKKAVESHLSLEKLLGHEKVPIPKDANDVEGWARFSKAMGIPDKADGYGLPDVQIPENLKAVTFDKQKFAEIVHSHKLTPAQAKGLWGVYTQLTMEAYQKAVTAQQQHLTTLVNQLRSEWGDAYETNVDLGQMVINKFAANKEDNDFLTASMTRDPRLVKFLSTIGSQFAENKIGDFKYQRFAKSPDEAQAEIDSILRNPNHAYNDKNASEGEHQRAVEYMNSLYAVINKAKQGQAT